MIFCLDWFESRKYLVRESREFEANAHSFQKTTYAFWFSRRFSEILKEMNGHLFEIKHFRKLRDLAISSSQLETVVCTCSSK